MRRLIIRPGAIGDFIVSLPALEHLRADFTELWCATANVPLGAFADCARSIANIGLDRLGILPADDVIARLREFDSIVSWYGTNRPEFRDFVDGLKVPFEFHSALPSGGLHAVDFYARQVGAPSGAVPTIPVTTSSADFIAIHPFASNMAKRWPLDRFQKVAEALGPVQWLRGPEEQLAGAMFIEDLGDLAAWLGKARLYIGNDSGITHLAAAVGVPVIALFGPTNPGVWGPRGRNVKVIHRSWIKFLRPRFWKVRPNCSKLQKQKRYTTRHLAPSSKG